MFGLYEHMFLQLTFVKLIGFVIANLLAVLLYCSNYIQLSSRCFYKLVSRHWWPTCTNIAMVIIHLKNRLSQLNVYT